jgi:hypothetical protein
MIIALLLAPLLIFAYAIVRSVVLFLPVMWTLGALHGYIPAVPALGWQATFLVVLLLSLLLPSGSSSSSD